jgi:hypothetical protein
VGTDAVGSARQGTSVALSSDGNTAIVGGPGDNPWDRSVPFGLGAAGAAWVFTRSGGVWTQQGNKLIGTGAVARQGTSVALSTDGNVAIVGGLAEDGGRIAAGNKLAMQALFARHRTPTAGSFDSSVMRRLPRIS